MKIVVINGSEKRGVTHKMKEIFLEPFKSDSEITEFYLPKDCPNFCTGCTTCLLVDENKCKDAEYIQKVDREIKEADLLVFTTPVYVYHASAAMKNLLDHFAYRWMVHRPSKEMFGKRAVIITQCIGGGWKSAAKDIKDSLQWWGISDIKVCAFKLGTSIRWDKLPEQKKTEIENKLSDVAQQYAKLNYAIPAKTNLMTKMKFYIVRMIQTNVGKNDTDYKDYVYWKEQGWVGKARPWK